ncbi:MAG: four helix bundle protein [Planctomycetes bacterium]|nr:four helix bundle protein [Planctomycetota bacterium]
MHNLNKLHIYQLARQNMKDLITITGQTTNIGDIHNQMQRAAISVVSNIAEGSGQRTNKQFLQFLGYARASNAELKAQLNILADLGKISPQHTLIDQTDCFAAKCTRFMQQLEV